MGVLTIHCMYAALVIVLPIAGVVLHGCGGGGGSATTPAPTTTSTVTTTQTLPGPSAPTEDVCRDATSSDFCKNITGCKFHVISGNSTVCWCETPGTGCQRKSPLFECNKMATQELCKTANASFYGCSFDDNTKMCTCGVFQKGCDGDGLRAASA